MLGKETLIVKNGTSSSSSSSADLDESMLLLSASSPFTYDLSMPSSTNGASSFGWSTEGAAMTVFFISSLSQLGTEAWKITSKWGLMIHIYPSTNLLNVLTYLLRTFRNTRNAICISRESCRVMDCTSCEGCSTWWNCWRETRSRKPSIWDMTRIGDRRVMLLN